MHDHLGFHSPFRDCFGQLYCAIGRDTGCSSRNSSKDSLGICNCSPFLEAASAVPPAAPATAPMAAPLPPPGIPPMGAPNPLPPRTFPARLLSPPLPFISYVPG